MTTNIRLNKVLTKADGTPLKSRSGDNFTVRHALMQALDKGQAGPFGAAAGRLLKRLRDASTTKAQLTDVEAAFLRALAVGFSSNWVNYQIARELGAETAAQPPAAKPADDPVSSEGDL